MRLRLITFAGRMPPSLPAHLRIQLAENRLHHRHITLLHSEFEQCHSPKVAQLVLAAATLLGQRRAVTSNSLLSSWPSLTTINHDYK